MVNANNYYYWHLFACITIDFYTCCWTSFVHIFLMTPKNVLVIGGSSFLGRRFTASNPVDLNIVGTYKSHPFVGGIYFDLEDIESSLKNVNFEKIDACLILSSITDPNQCYEDKLKSREINIVSTKILIDFLIKKNIAIIFTSTEFIYDGLIGAYTEEDLPNPILEYGMQKLAIENHLILSGCDRYTIFRIAKMYDINPDEITLLQSFYHELTNKKVINVAFDQIFSPLFVGDICEYMAYSVKNSVYGVFNCAGNSSGSRYYFCKLFKSLLAKRGIQTADVVPCSIDSFNLPEIRPKNVSMLPTKLNTYFKCGNSDIKLKMEEYILEMHRG
jgi:dTDP-4-dehydrorhamnose reductase